MNRQAIKSIFNYSFNIYFILLLCFVVRLYSANTIWMNPDEGTWLYDASLVLKGYTPFADYASRDPLYLLLLLPFIEFFGNTLLAGRLLSVIFEVGSTFMIFLIGKKLYNKNIGLLASLIYTISPIFIFWNSILKTEPIQQLFVLLAMYFLINGIKIDNRRQLFLNGIFLGLAILVRKSAVVFLITELFFIYCNSKNLTKTVKKMFVIGSGALFSLLPFLIFMINTKPFYDMAGVNVFSRFALQLNTFFINHLGMINILVKEGLYLIAPLSIFFIFFLSGRTKKIPFKSMAYFVPFIAFLYILGDVYAYYFMKNQLNLSILFILFFSSIIMLISILFNPVLKIIVPFIKKQNYNAFSNNFLMFWFIGPFLFYLIYYTWHVSYFTELSSVVCLMSALIIHSMIKNKENKFVKIFLILLVSSALFAQSLHFYQPYSQSRGIDRIIYPKTVERVSSHILAHTAENEEIFANPIFAFVSDRRVIFDISHPILYHYPRTNAELSLINYPAITEIQDYLETNKINYVIDEISMQESFFLVYPAFKEYIGSNYTIEKEMDNVKIFRRRT